MAQAITLQDSDIEQAPTGPKTLSAADIEGGGHGASGSWAPEVSPAEQAVRTIIGPLANFGKNAAEGLGGVVHTPIDLAHAAGMNTPPTNGQEQNAATIGGGLGLLTHRLIIQPTLDNAKAWWSQISGSTDSTAAERVANLMGTIPVGGPIIKSLIDQARKGDVSGAAGRAAGMYLGGKAIEGVSGKILKPGEDTAGSTVDSIKNAVSSRAAYAQPRPLINMTPEGHLQTALKPDLDPEGLTLAGQMLKEGEARIGKPVKDVDTAKAAEKAQFQEELMPTRRSIIDPQKEVTVPGSKEELIQAKIKAIPADIRPGTPEYQAAVKRAKLSVPKDLTIGELEQINSSLNSQNRALHTAQFGTALSKLENTNAAMDAAAEQTTRQLMERGMEENGLGGADRLKDVNKRIGVGIKLRNSIDAMESQARTEAALPHFRRLTANPVTDYLKNKATVNEGIANAMRKWTSKADPIQRGPEWGPKGANRLLPASTSIDLGPSPDTSSVTGTPATPAELSTNGRPKLLVAHGQTGGPHALPEDMHPETMQSGVTGQPATLAKGPFSGQPIEGTQIPLQPTVIRSGARAGRPSTPIFGESQTSAAATAAQKATPIPEGSILSFKSKTLDGREAYHYQTPDGQIIESDKELDLDEGGKVKAKQFSGYKGPTPPPRLRSSKKKL